VKGLGSLFYAESAKTLHGKESRLWRGESVYVAFFREAKSNDRSAVLALATVFLALAVLNTHAIVSCSYHRFWPEFSIPLTGT